MKLNLTRRQRILAMALSRVAEAHRNDDAAMAVVKEAVRAAGDACNNRARFDRRAFNVLSNSFGW
jgi:hypothetical protein